MGWFFPSFISQFPIYLGLGKNPISSCVDLRRGLNQAWCGLQVCFRRRRWEAESGRYYSSGLGRIDRLELGKTLYSVFVLHSGSFRSVEGSWFFISSEVFCVKIWYHCLFLSFYSLIYFQVFISLVIWAYMLNWRKMSWTRCDHPLDILNNFSVHFG